MSFSDTEALKRQLLANDTKFAELAHTHGEYERRLSELAELHYPSVEEQMEEATLKKKKLYLKDQMETILQHRLKHRFLRLRSITGRDLRNHVEPIHLQPAWPADHLVRIDAVSIPNKVHHGCLTQLVPAAAQDAATHERIRAAGARMDISHVKCGRGAGGLAKRRARQKGDERPAAEQQLVRDQQRTSDLAALRDAAVLGARQLFSPRGEASRGFVHFVQHPAFSLNEFSQVIMQAWDSRPEQKCVQGKSEFL